MWMIEYVDPTLNQYVAYNDHQFETEHAARTELDDVLLRDTETRSHCFRLARYELQETRVFKLVWMEKKD